MVTKTLHLKTFSDLSTVAFSNTLKRFIARRGKLRAIFSDNRTNFVGTDNLLERSHKSFKTENGVQDYKSTQTIEWHFDSSQALHMGGLYESAVKSCETLLRKVFGELILNFKELSTLMSQIEAILNFRPLILITNDPYNLNLLTPGYFLLADQVPVHPSLTRQMFWAVR